MLFGFGLKEQSLDMTQRETRKGAEMRVDSAEFMNRFAALQGEYPQQKRVFDGTDAV